MGKRTELETNFKVVCIPCPPVMAEARRAGLLMLLQWIKEDLISNPVVDEVNDGFMDGNRNGDDGGISVALFPLAHVAERKRAATPGSLYAWAIGHDGSAHRVALGSWPG